jgi:branched-chain amino acid transport system permease protein
MTSKQWTRYAAVAAGLLVIALPLIISSGYTVRVLNNILLYSILALGLNLIGGYGGQLAMGHACYYGIGAYTSALLMLNLGWPFLPSLLAATAAAGLFGLLTGWLAMARITGDYLMLITMGISEITRIVFMNWVPVTRGPMGIPQVPPAKLFSFTFTSGMHYYYLFLVCLVIGVLVIRKLVGSKFGRALVAIREDETAARAMGINATFYKVAAFAISAVFAGVAGSLMASYNRFVGPMQFSLEEGLLLFQMIIVGGLGSISGSILGAAILVTVPEVFRPIYQYRMLINGLLMVLLMIWRPQGLLGMTGGAHPYVRWVMKLRSLLGVRADAGAGKAGKQ